MVGSLREPTLQYSRQTGSTPMRPQPITPDHILDFWFRQTDPAQWWQKSAAFDALIRDRFGALHEAATRCELFAWRVSPRGRLAEVIVLDQFSRNIHRDTPRAFAADPLALSLAQTAIAAGIDDVLPVEQRAFLYMPFMHSESPAMHRFALMLFATPGMASNLESEFEHKATIDRFGRYPHRNAILGRASTADEIAFLQEPGSSF
jgi:uncharacterized protein (DUF924 family)